MKLDWKTYLCSFHHHVLLPLKTSLKFHHHFAFAETNFTVFYRLQSMQLQISLQAQYNIKLTINAAIDISFSFDARPHIEQCIEYSIINVYSQ